jgi:predicted DNA-binding protein
MQYLVELAQPWAEALADVAKMAGKTESKLLAELVYKHLEDLDDHYWATEAVERFIAGGRVTHPAEEVYARLEEHWSKDEVAA